MCNVNLTWHIKWGVYIWQQTASDKNYEVYCSYEKDTKDRDCCACAPYLRPSSNHRWIKRSFQTPSRNFHIIFWQTWMESGNIAIEVNFCKSNRTVVPFNYLSIERLSCQLCLKINYKKSQLWCFCPPKMPSLLLITYFWCYFYW